MKCPLPCNQFDSMLHFTFAFSYNYLVEMVLKFLIFVRNFSLFLFSFLDFFQLLMINTIAGKGKEASLYLSTNSNHSRTFVKSCHVFILGDCSWTRNHNSAKFLPVWLTGWVFIYELSGCGFESSCSHLNFRFRACFKQEVPWHSDNYRV